jgi:hypothetical protein
MSNDLAKRLRDSAYGTADPRPILLEAAAALETPLPADLATLVAASREWLIHNATESCDPVARLCDALEAQNARAFAAELEVSKWILELIEGLGIPYTRDRKTILDAIEALVRPAEQSDGITVVAPPLPEGYPEWFQRVYGYAATQTFCIVALSRCTTQDFYHLVNAALRELGIEPTEKL